ncbi:MAG: hypothetical protein ACP5NV_04225 [Candidatus Woesearchaeota archaeon]
MKDPFASDNLSAVDEFLDTLTRHVNRDINKNIKSFNPLSLAKNLHKGSYIEKANYSQLWIMKNLYEQIQYVSGLVDIGNKFLSQKNYHGAYESFHAAKYTPGLLDIVKNVVQEVKSKKPYVRDHIGYAKKALVDIVKLDHIAKIEGKEGVTQLNHYINTIAEAYIQEYESLPVRNVERKQYLEHAKELYSLNKNILGKLKVSGKLISYNWHTPDEYHHKNINKKPLISGIF